MPYRVQLPRGTGEDLSSSGSSLYSKEPVLPVPPVPPVTEVYRARLHRLGVEPPKPAPDSGMVARLVRMPLDQFEREGCPLEVRVPWHTETLWFVPTEADAEVLDREGVSRGRIWTARELADLLAVSGLTPEQPQTIARVKLEFGGEVVEVQTRRYGDPERGGEPA